MKRFRQTPFLLTIFSMLPMLLTLFVPDFCYARLEWKSIGPEGGNIRVLAIDPSNSNIIYAGTNGGVFKSTNGGGTWNAVNSGLTNTSVSTLAIDPSNSNIIYAGTGGGGVFKSSIEGIVDFNGDGKADILWQHTSTGTVAMWLMNGTTISSVGVAGAVSSDWQFKGVGDFDGDGKFDILFQSTSGTIGIWLMDGLSIKPDGVGYPGGTDWEIKGVGDFDGDGKFDILFQSSIFQFETTLRAVGIWLIEGLTIKPNGVAVLRGSAWSIITR